MRVSISDLDLRGCHACQGKRAEMIGILVGFVDFCFLTSAFVKCMQLMYHYGYTPLVTSACYSIGLLYAFHLFGIIACWYGITKELSSWIVPKIVLKTSTVIVSFSITCLLAFFIATNPRYMGELTATGLQVDYLDHKSAIDVGTTVLVTISAAFAMGQTWLLLLLFHCYKKTRSKELQRLLEEALRKEKEKEELRRKEGRLVGRLDGLDRTFSIIVLSFSTFIGPFLKRHGKDKGAPGPPQVINDVLAEQDTHYTREVHALVMLCLVVVIFLIIVGLLYCIHWLCVLTKSKSYRDSFASQKSYAEKGETPSEPVAEPPQPFHEDKIISHSEQISESDSAKRCYPSQELTVELDIPKRKRSSEKEVPAADKVRRPVPDYSSIVLKNNCMYVGGLSKCPREPPSYLSTVEKPGTQTPVFASRSVFGTSMIFATKRPYSNKYKIVDKMKIANAPILTAPKKSTSSSVKTAVEGSHQVGPGQAIRQQHLVQTPGAAPIQSTQLDTPSTLNTLMSTAKNPTPVSVPYTGPGVKITGQSSVRTASIAEAVTVGGVKITAAPVSITAMRRKPIPQAFKATPPQVVQSQETSAGIPVTTLLQNARDTTPKSEASISGLTNLTITSETSTKTSIVDPFRKEEGL